MPCPLADVALVIIFWVLPGILGGAWAQNPQLEAIEAKRNQIEQIVVAVDKSAEHLAWLKFFLVDRFQNLQERIRDERQRFDEFEDSAVAGISRAFQQDLRNASASHIDLLVRLLELSERVGEADEVLRAELKGTLTVAAEAVSGQVPLDATTLKELRSMLRADPGGHRAFGVRLRAGGTIAEGENVIILGSLQGLLHHQLVAAVHLQTIKL